VCADASERPGLAVVVVNWNGREHLAGCIGSLLECGVDPLRIVLVDNASVDDSVEFCRAAFPSVEIIESDTNRYWAGGNNLGLKHLCATGCPEYVLLLNNDTIVPAGGLELLVDALEEEPAAWAATPRICYADEPSLVWYDGGRIGSWSGWVHHEGIRRQAGSRPLDSRFTEYGTGCALLVTRTALENVGLLDESYTFYGEDADYCLRLREAGGQVLHVPRALVLHKVSASLGAWSPRKAQLRSISHVMLLRRHWRGWRAWTAAVLQVPYFAGHAVWHLWHGRPEVARAVILGALEGLRRGTPTQSGG
jgi:hypothetical protein